MSTLFFLDKLKLPRQYA